MLVTALSALSFPVHAYPSIEGKSSTLGFGVEVAFLMTRSVDTHIGLPPFKYSLSKSAASNSITTNFSGNLNLVSLETLADLGSLSIGSNPYTVVPKQSENATIDFNKMVPSVGIGWGRTTKNPGLSFTNDIGIMFQGLPNTSVTTNSSGEVATNINQTNTDLNNSLNNFKIYPFISIGVGYTF